MQRKGPEREQDGNDLLVARVCVIQIYIREGVETVVSAYTDWKSEFRSLSDDLMDSVLTIPR